MMKNGAKLSTKPVEAGAALIEAAIVIPVFLLITAWAVELCLYVLLQRTVTSANRAAIEYAVGLPDLGVDPVTDTARIKAVVAGILKEPADVSFSGPATTAPILTAAGQVCNNQVTVEVKNVKYVPTFLKLIGMSEFTISDKRSMRYLQQPLCY